MKFLKDVRVKGGLIHSDEVRIAHVIKETGSGNVQHEIMFCPQGNTRPFFSFTVTVPKDYTRIDLKGDVQKLELRFTGTGAHFQPYRKRRLGLKNDD